MAEAALLRVVVHMQALRARRAALRLMARVMHPTNAGRIVAETPIGVSAAYPVRLVSSLLRLIKALAGMSV
jgi:hypothetical protein